MNDFDPVRQAENKLREIGRKMLHDVETSMSNRPLSTPQSAGQALLDKNLFTWTTAEGKRFFVWELSDNHLLNCLKSLLRRNLENPYILYELARREFFNKKGGQNG